MTAMAILILVAADPAVEVRAVRLTPVSSRLALRVLTSASLEAPDVRRVGEEVVIVLGDVSAEAVLLPPLEPPVEALRFEPGDGGLALHVKVAPEVPFETVREDSLLTVLFGEEQAEDLRLKSARELYGHLFPVPLGEGASPAGGETNATNETPTGPVEGWSLGRLSVKPGLTASFVGADVVTEEASAPVRDQYLQIGPTVELGLPVADGSLRAAYEPRFRLFSSIPEVGTATHIVNAVLDLPVGPRVVVQGNYHFSHGVLETREVDPGQEYFFDLGRFDRNDVWGTVSVELGSRMTAVVGAELNHVDFTGSDQFFPYDEKSVRAGVSYEVAGETRATASYVYHRVPPPEGRPLVEATGHDLLAGIDGQIGPLLRGRVEVGYRNWSSPEAALSGQRYSGLVASLTLQRQLGPNTLLELRGGRQTDLSNFTDNAFYVSTFVGGAITAPVPLGLSARAATGYQWNTYRVVEASIGETREDTIFGWTLGLGRNLGFRSYVRADYRRDRRRSNIPGLSVTTDGIVVQFGIGFAPSGARR